MDRKPLFLDEENVPFSENVQFIMDIITEFNVKNIDYLACNTLNYSKYTKYYDLLFSSTGVIVGASNDKTGNIKYGGDWVMENTSQDIELIYFTQSIEYYTYLLDTSIVYTFSSGLSYPYGLAFDTSGNLYCSNTNNNTISKILPNGTVSEFVSSGLSGPSGLAFDSIGNLYCANYNGNNSTISKILPNRTVSTFASGLNYPDGLAFDSIGNLYCANSGNNTISKINSVGIIIYTISGLNAPFGLAFDTAGNLYCSNFNSNTISKINSVGTIVATISGLSRPVGLAFDTAGNLYCANPGNNTISKILPNRTVSTFVFSGLFQPYGLAFDSIGNLYCANNTINGSISRTVGFPINVNASQVSGTTNVTISWAAPTVNSGPAVTGYTIYNNGTTLITTITGTSTFSYIATNITQPYSFSVLANYSSGNSQLSSTIPTSPTSVTAVQSATTANVLISWSAPTSNGGSTITKYTVYTNGSSQGADVSGNILTYTTPLLTLGQTYNFTVAAQNALGTGSASSPAVSVTILAPPPTPPIPVPCFNHDTKILCLNKFSKEEYVPIQDLRKGDMVKTYLHGYKRIDMIGMDTMINNPDNWQECMFKMEKTEENALTEDLIVTGWHSVLVKNLTPEQEEKHKELDFIYHIDNKCLLLASVSEDFQKLENRDDYTYYNLTLESSSETKRYGIYANGILVETPSKKQFLKHAYKELM